MLKRPFKIVVAQTRQRGIGLNGDIPWPRLNLDMARFAKITKQTAKPDTMNAVIMGRRTWESIPDKYRPLPERYNVVISSQSTSDLIASTKAATTSNTTVASSFEEAMKLLSSEPISSKIENVYVIGGGQVYQTAIAHPQCQEIIVTEVLKNYKADVFMPVIPSSLFSLTESSDDIVMDNGVPTQYLTYTRITNGNGSEGESKSVGASLPVRQTNHEEQQYLDLISRIIATGNRKEDRTGVGTLSLFGCSMRFSLRDNRFPLLTTKRVFWRGVAEELLWFIHGKTNARLLSDKGVKIWDGNGSRAFLDKTGLGYREEMDLGPVYGFQWRHFGANYIDCHANYQGKGVDQLADVIHQIRTNPDSRRIIMSAWNPVDIPKMALPPCHVLCQFYVSKRPANTKNQASSSNNQENNGEQESKEDDRELSCILYQRSCDIGLGIPFNIASYSLLTYMLAHITGLKPGEFIHMMGDTHVYLNHVEPLKEQIKREPRPFPTLTFKKRDNLKEITDFTMDDFELNGYNPYPTIKMDMAV